METSFSQKMTKGELEVLRKCMEQFKGEDVIVADQHTQQFDIIPFHDERISISSGKASYIGIKIQRKIYHNDKPYVVGFRLVNYAGREKPGELKPLQIDIAGNGIIHYNRFVGENLPKYDWLDEIAELFGEKEIKSPLEEYGDRMISNSKLPELIKNHEWDKIANGIDQIPALADALFLESEDCTTEAGYDDDSLTSERKFSANFGTLLYHLITFRKNSIGTIGEKELKKLDALILKLSDSDLLKVEFINLEEEEAYLPPHILSVFFDSQVYVKKNTTISRQYNAENNELSDEEKVLQMIKTRSR